jgi:ubiquitin carboxyl-terminal hydrolase L5
MHSLAETRCTIESSPAVFTELLAGIGAAGIQVEELYALDRSLFDSLEPIHGLVFLFPFTGDQASRSNARQGTVLAAPPKNVFFAHQVIQNACATQALLSVVLNAPGVALGDELQNFTSFTKDFDPMTKGLAISNSETIRSVHNSFAPQSFVVENAPIPEADKEPPYHFISFVPSGGHVYELDGLAEGPRRHGEYDEATDWLDVVTPVIEARMQEYSAEGEIRFTLLAVCDDIAARLKAESAAAPDDAELAARAEGAAEKRAVWGKDNARRRHNWVPFIVQTLKCVAEAGLIDGVIDDATKRKQARIDDEAATKAARGPAGR